MASPENHASHLNDDKRDEADVTDDTNAKVVAEGLPDLDTIADAEVRHLAGLDCMEHSRHNIQLKVERCSSDIPLNELSVSTCDQNLHAKIG